MAYRKSIDLTEKRSRVNRVVSQNETGSRVGDVMTPNPLTVDFHVPVAELLSLFEQYQIEHLLVVENGQLAGMLRDRDIARIFTAEDHDAQAFRQLRAVDLMRTDPAQVDPTADLATAARTMVENGVHCLPVTDEGRPIGVITTTDLLLALESLVACVH
jgi:CBS domain-containing protein